jgi:hypothetical protein
MGPMVVVVAIAVSLGAGLALAVRREDRQYSLTRQAPSITARGVRRLTGVGLRDITPPSARLPYGVRIVR